MGLTGVEWANIYNHGLDDSDLKPLINDIGVLTDMVMKQQIEIERLKDIVRRGGQLLK